LFTSKRLCVLLTLFVFSAPALAEEKKRHKRPAPSVVVAQAEQTMLSPSVMVSATVISRQEAAVPSEVNGRLIWVAEVGSEFTKGEAVAILDDTMHRLSLSESKAALRREKARLKFTDSELKRLQTLRSSAYAAVSQLDKLQLDREVIASELAVNRAKLALDEELLKRYHVRAPFSGVVKKRERREGEWVDSGSSVLSMSNPNSLEVRAHVSEQSVEHLQQGQDIQVFQANHSGIGKVRAIVPVGDDQSLLFDVRVAVSGEQWRAGQSVRLLMPTGAARNVMAVPRDALVLRRTGSYVFRIPQEGPAERIEVQTGIASGDIIEVLGDLNAGDNVVIRGGERLRPGQTVNIVAGK
jgi:RND family efflux transporter MFP subunit